MSALLALAFHLSALLDATPPVVVVLHKGKPCGGAVVVDPRGYLVTCHHVVGRQQKVLVAFRDGSSLSADVVAGDPANDLMLLKLEGEGRWLYRPVVLVDLPPRVGQRVYCHGHPTGFIYSLSAGIVSATGRNLEMPDGGDPLRGLFQTDAAVNPGCSGSAILDEQGRLLGLPVAIKDGAQGVAFAVPATTVKRFLDKSLPAR